MKHRGNGALERYFGVTSAQLRRQLQFTERIGLLKKSGLGRLCSHRSLNLPKDRTGLERSQVCGVLTETSRDLIVLSQECPPCSTIKPEASLICFEEAKGDETVARAVGAGQHLPGILFSCLRR